MDKNTLSEQILDVIVSEGKIERSIITSDSTLQTLEIQSIEVVMILMAIEEKFGVYIPIDGPIADTKDLAGFVDGVADRILQERS